MKSFHPKAIFSGRKGMMMRPCILGMMVMFFLMRVSRIKMKMRHHVMQQDNRIQTGHYPGNHFETCIHYVKNNNN